MTPWSSSLSWLAEVFGLGTIDQTDPFHDSVSVWSGLAAGEAGAYGDAGTTGPTTPLPGELTLGSRC